MKTLLAALASLALSLQANAALIQIFNLAGSTVQNSLHFLNEPGGILSGGTGGEIGAGIFLDDNNDADPNTNTLTINVGWGSSQGFADLSSTATASHIHGPTAGNNGGGGFTQTAGVFAGLTRSSSATTGGTITQNVPYTSAAVTDLLNGKHYINIHTSNNPGGEIRGFIVVPEPSTALLGLLGGASMLAFRRRR